MNTFKFAFAAGFALLTGYSAATTEAHLDARVELVAPFEGQRLETTSPDLYVRVVNTGTAPIFVGKDLLFEVGGIETELHQPAGLHPSSQPTTREQFEARYGRKSKLGVMVPPGHAYAMSEVDYGIHNLGTRVAQPVRVHYRVANDHWVTSEWLEPTIAPRPKLIGDPLLRYQISEGGPKSAVSIAEIGDERWVVLNADQTSRSTYSRGIYRRVCRVPPGAPPVSVSLDQGARILTVRFPDGEPDVVFDNRNGVPLSGSERTVPHLHLWEQFAGRPFTRLGGVIDPNVKARFSDTVKVEISKAEEHDTERISTSAPLKEEGAVSGAWKPTIPGWLNWLAGGLAVLGLVGFAIWRVIRRRS